MKNNTHYILKMRDTFGDVWPMLPTTGILGLEFSSKREAIAFFNSKKQTKEGRVEMRLSGGWQQNTASAIEVHKVVIA